MKFLALYFFIIAALHLPVLAITTIANPGPVGRPQPPSAGWALVTGAHTAKEAPGSGGITTDAIDTSTCTFLCVATFHYSTSGTLTDSQGGGSNTWVAGPPSVYTNTGFSIQLHYSTGANLTHVGAGHTFSYNGGYAAVMVAGFTGNQASPYDAENGATSLTTGTTIATGSVTPAGLNQLFITAMDIATSIGTLSISDSFTIIDQINGVSTNVGLAWKIASSAQNPTWTFNAAGTLGSAAIATFK